MHKKPEEVFPRVNTGVAGIDEALGGGFPRTWTCLVQGASGTGRTTFGLQFLLAGVRAGEAVLFITLSQSKQRLQQIARSHGWSLEEDHIIHEVQRGAAAEQTILHTAEVELDETVNALAEAIARAAPDRVVFDSIAEIRHLAGNPLRYRRQLQRLRNMLPEPCTALFLDYPSSDTGDIELAGIVDGILQLERVVPDYGDVQRRLKISKMRGIAYHGGYHNFRIHTGGLRVFPRLKVKGEQAPAEKSGIRSGVDALDEMLGGGLEKGTACLVIGAAGTGKTTLGTLYAHAVAEQDEHAVVFTFDERPMTFLQRAKGIGLDLRPHMEAGRFRLQQIDAGELTPGEFADKIRRAVEEDQAQVIVIDSLTGYFNAMPQEKLLLPQLHEMLAFASRRGVFTILIVAQQGLVGTGLQAPVDISYLADTVILLRHFEAAGRMHKAIAVVVKRYGPHDKQIRAFSISSEGVQVGGPLEEITGILAGNPRYEGRQPPADAGEGRHGHEQE